VKITASGISLNVADERASAEFLKRHLGFETEMESEGFVSLSRPDAGYNVVFLRTGLATFKPEALAGHRADGLLLVFVVEDIDAVTRGSSPRASRSRRRSRPNHGASAISR
jgi:catechol 2,3-dioxygenase-like lactoylglutathione lyase family enzyme